MADQSASQASTAVRPKAGQEKKGLRGRGLINIGVFTALYFVTGRFTPFIILMLVCYVIVEAIRAATKYKSFWGDAFSYAVFGLRACGSPLPIWTMRDASFEQIQPQGMSAEYVDAFA